LNLGEHSTPEKEQSWLEDEILRKATRQIRDTMSYLPNFLKNEVRNNRGDVFDIATALTCNPQELVIS
jgi:hypothetical protein